MNPLLGVPLFIILAGLQSGLAQPLVTISGLPPDLVVLAAISCGLLAGPRSGVAWGAVGGLALGLASAGPVLADGLALAIVGLLSGFAQASLGRGNRVLIWVIAFAGVVVFDLLHMLLLQLNGWDFNWIVSIYEIVLPSALVDLATMPLIYGPLYWLRSRSQPRPEIGW